MIYWRRTTHIQWQHRHRKHQHTHTRTCITAHQNRPKNYTHTNTTLKTYTLHIQCIQHRKLHIDEATETKSFVCCCRRCYAYNNPHTICYLLPNTNKPQYALNWMRSPFSFHSFMFSFSHSHVNWSWILGVFHVFSPFASDENRIRYCNFCAYSHELQMFVRSKWLPSGTFETVDNFYALPKRICAFRVFSWSTLIDGFSGSFESDTYRWTN